MKKALRYPTLKQIMDGIECDEDTAKAILSALQTHGEDDEARLKLVDKIMDGCGVEGIGECDIRLGPPLLYVNMGDTYATTICLFRERFIVSDWGTIVEKHPSLFKN